MSTATPSTLPGISCINAFHGRTLGVLSFTFSKPTAWPKGKYKVEVLLNDVSAGTKEWEVK